MYGYHLYPWGADDGYGLYGTCMYFLAKSSSWSHAAVLCGEESQPAN